MKAVLPKETILVVEDGDDVRALVSRTLILNGYQVLEASDGLEALQLIESHGEQIRLVLTDVVMPRMDGIELARRLARLRPDTRIAFMSGYSDDPLLWRSGNRNVLFLQKPFGSLTLVKKIRELLETDWRGVPGLHESQTGE